MSAPTNLFADLPAALPQELFTTLLSTASFRVERIVSLGHASPPDAWYDQADHEWVLLLRGAARLQFDDEIRTLRPGDYVNIPAHRRHRVDWTSSDEPTVWLAIYYHDVVAVPSE